MSKVSFSLDWISVTFVFQDLQEVFYPPTKMSFEVTETRGIGSYNQGVTCQYFSVYWHSEHPENKVLLVMTGTQLSEYRKGGNTESDLLVHFIKLKGNFTRLDFAMDIFDSEGKPEDLYNRWHTPGLITKARSVNIVQGRREKENTGTTVYIGSRQSERMIRIYDKGKQSGLKLDWLRAELEYKGGRANQLAEAMTKYGINNGGVVHMRQFIQFTDVDWFEKALQGEYEEFEIESIGRPETDHDKWLRKVVLPAVSEAIRTKTPGFLEAIQAILQDAEDEKYQHGPSLTPTN